MGREALRSSMRSGQSGSMQDPASVPAPIGRKSSTPCPSAFSRIQLKATSGSSPHSTQRSAT